jgi:Rps23 Pro-64 3,4-dihydroxylase Tpa1-like proline 4-hydroxylase
MFIESLQKINLAPFEIQTKPFHYFVSQEIFDNQISVEILSWFETAAPWTLIETDFYEQYEFDFLNVELPANLLFLGEKAFLNNLIRETEEIFETKLKGHIDITAHKLLSGQTIRVHNDYVEGKETHRLVIQLNRGWKDENGGFLMFFNSSDPKDLHRIIRPVHNTSVGFAIGPSSNHAVSKIHSGERYTLVFSFYESR